MKTEKRGRKYNGAYTGEYLNRVAFPLGGLGAGMVCLEGTGALSHVAVRNKPSVFHEPCLFSAICVKGRKNVARVLEGPVPMWKVFWNPNHGGAAYGLPRFASAKFTARFPFASVELDDEKIPLKVTLTGWSPFIPNDADGSSLPVAALEYKFVNKTKKRLEAVYSFNARNHMAVGKKQDRVYGVPKGFVLHQPGSKEKPWEEGAFCASVTEPGARVNLAWFRGGWFDPLTMAWRDIERGACYDQPEPDSAFAGKPPLVELADGTASTTPAAREHWASPGATIFVPVNLPPGGEKTIRLMLSWYVPLSDLRTGPDEKCGENCACSDSDKPRTYQPWYAGKFAGIGEVNSHWRENYENLRKESQRFSDCFFDTNLPPEAVEAAAANLSILKSTTVLRQPDGRLWCWEGCGDNTGCCNGSCTHVWNYAQALAHLFPALERSLRETEFFESQDERGHQNFRAALPIRITDHNFPAAADGQPGGVMKVYREWRICGDTAWLRKLWPKVRQSLDYCIEEWDPKHNGCGVEPQHNTYDIEFWGANGMCASFYLGALWAAVEMGRALEDDVTFYDQLFRKGLAFFHDKLFNGEFFIQRTQWKGLRSAEPLKAKVILGAAYSAEAAKIVAKEGPKYQYGAGCLSDGVLGAWLAEMCGLEQFADRRKLRRHLAAVHKYNFKGDLTEHVNPQRTSYALGREAGLLLCTWPKGGEPSLPFPYSNEVWTGIEYQAASHLILEGMVAQGLQIVRAVRARHDGRVRNPFNEYECGHWYGRALSSYALLRALTGARYDAVDKTLHLHPRLKGDFRGFLCTATGYGTVGVKKGKPFMEVKQGAIAVEKIIASKDK